MTGVPRRYLHKWSTTWNKTANIDVYTDGTTLYASGKNLTEIELKLQFDPDNIISLCNQNNMGSNPIKPHVC